MDRGLIEQKIESLRRCVARVKEKFPSDATRLTTDFDCQDIIAVNIERAVQQCINIAAHIVADYDQSKGTSAASLFLDLAHQGLISESLSERLARTIGFRNLLVHRYATIDWERVFQSVHSDVSVFQEFAEAVTNFARQ